MAYCQSAENIKNSEGKPSWIHLQLQAHVARCGLCALIEEASANGGNLSTETVKSLRLPTTESTSNGWTGTKSRTWAVYEGQYIPVEG